jgi:hypothetical protein
MVLADSRTFRDRFVTQLKEGNRITLVLRGWGTVSGKIECTGVDFIEMSSKTRKWAINLSQEDILGIVWDNESSESTLPTKRPRPIR